MKKINNELYENTKLKTMGVCKVEFIKIYWQL